MIDMPNIIYYSGYISSIILLFITHYMVDNEADMGDYIVSVGSVGIISGILLWPVIILSCFVIIIAKKISDWRIQ